MNNELVKYTTDTGVEVKLDSNIIRRQIAKNDKVTDIEIQDFMQLCVAQRLNPFLKEAYLIKYGDHPATIVTGKDVFTKRANKNERFDGYQAGVSVVASSGELVQREGSMVLPGEKLIGGWAKVYLKNTTVPMYEEVSLSEYQGTTAEGKPNRQWAKMPGTMIRKVALVHALREAFPEDLQGLYDSSELQQSVDLSDSEPTQSCQEVTCEVVDVDWREEVLPQIADLIGRSKLSDEDKMRHIGGLKTLSEEQARALLAKLSEAAQKSEA